MKWLRIVAHTVMIAFSCSIVHFMKGVNILTNRYLDVYIDYESDYCANGVGIKHLCFSSCKERFIAAKSINEVLSLLKNRRVVVDYIIYVRNEKEEDNND